MKVNSQLKDAQLEIKSGGPANRKGAIALDSADNKVKYRDHSKVEREVANTDEAQELTNKTINLDNNTLTNLSDSNIKAGANIDHSKMNALTADRALVSDGSGVVTPSTVTGTELARLSGVASNVLGETDTQSASNKTFSASKFTDHLEVAEQGSTPSTPSSGFSRIYPKNDGKWYYLNSSGAEQEVGSGSGSGEENFIDSNNSELADGTIGDWETYKDSGAYVDGTGGISGLTISATSDSGEVLSGDFALKIIKPSLDVQHEGVSLGSISIPRGYRNKILKLSALVDFSAMTGEHVEIRAYDETNSKEIYCGDSETIAVPAQIGMVMVPVYLADDCASVRISLHFKDASSDGYNLIATKFKINSITTVSVAQQTGLKTWTPITQGFGTIGLDTAAYSIYGNHMRGQVKFTAGTVTSDEAQVSLPDIELDTSAYSNGYQDTNIVGVATISGSKEIVTVLLDKTETGVLKFGVAGASYTGQNKFLGNQILSSSQQITISFDLFVKDSRQIINEFELSQQTNKGRIVLGTVHTHNASGSWQKINLDTSDYDVGGLVDTSNGKITVRKSDYYTLTGSLGFATNTNGNRGVRIYVDGTEKLAAIHDAANSSVSNVVRASDTIYIEKDSDIELYGFQDSGGNLNINASDVQSSLSVVQQPDFTHYGVVKNYASDSVYGILGATVNTSNTFGNAASIVIPYSGKYKIWGHIEAYNTTARTNPYWHRVFISENSGTSIADLEEGRNTNRVYIGNGINDRNTAYIQPFELDVPEGGITLYLKQTISEPASDGTVAQSYNISYERVR